MSDKYHIVTYGCQMNSRESEKLAGVLEALGYTKTDRRDDADVVVFNTCTVRENAVKRLMGNIGALKRQKAINRNMIIAVLGCATQNKKDAELIYKRFPFVDIILGTYNIGELGEYIKNRASSKRVLSVLDSDIGFEDLPSVRDNKFSAYVNIMYGCNNFCSYCIVPYVRGRERSRPAEDILSEVRALVESGFREITLLGQNVNSYGSGGDVTFAQLLRMISKIEGKFRIKFMTSHPKDLSNELISEIATNQKVCKHIHLPAQSGSNRILAAMNRGYTREDYLSLISRINAIEGANITSDIIVGFPDETAEDYQDTLRLLDEARFSAVYAFMFSPRTGTKAATLSNNVPDAEKRARLIELLDRQKVITSEIAKGKLFKEFEVLCIRGEENKLIALTLSDEVIHLDRYVEGEFFNVRVTAVRGGRLFGEIIS